nr:MAG TPA: hypothetical protein [Caudoviricetes sp.]
MRRFGFMRRFSSSGTLNNCRLTLALFLFSFVGCLLLCQLFKTLSFAESLRQATCLLVVFLCLECVSRQVMDNSEVFFRLCDEAVNLRLDILQGAGGIQPCDLAGAHPFRRTGFLPVVGDCFVLFILLLVLERLHLSVDGFNRLVNDADDLIDLCLEVVERLHVLPLLPDAFVVQRLLQPVQVCSVSLSSLDLIVRVDDGSILRCLRGQLCFQFLIVPCNGLRDCVGNQFQFHCGILLLFSKDFRQHQWRSFVPFDITPELRAFRHQIVDVVLHIVPIYQVVPCLQSGHVFALRFKLCFEEAEICLHHRHIEKALAKVVLRYLVSPFRPLSRSKHLTGLNLQHAHAPVLVIHPSIQAGFCPWKAVIFPCVVFHIFHTVLWKIQSEQPAQVSLCLCAVLHTWFIRYVLALPSSCFQLPQGHVVHVWVHTDHSCDFTAAETFPAVFQPILVRFQSLHFNCHCLTASAVLS